MGQAGTVVVAMEAERLKWVCVPKVLEKLKGLYGLTDGQIGSVLGLSERDIQRRRVSKVRITPDELAGLAALFDVPPEVFYLSPAEAVRIVGERDPELDAPRRAGVGWAARDSNPEPAG